eukprot:CAMPEP_0113875566 /NCGR_PEP_ID=MMETSP0780_2-20120614/5015_1 /TAXON_ID=652834 /ORGANISM="Palpitomonas bilix" /LENGTH=1101 /DNA_ID=CAMNT_0000861573 /DNA_START=295 /DNA_END=3597 /DNA_ORIENTATION=+ /assembly_acc=CAM_ASM_000599
MMEERRYLLQVHTKYLRGSGIHHNDQETQDVVDDLFQSQTSRWKVPVLLEEDFFKNDLHLHNDLRIYDTFFQHCQAWTDEQGRSLWNRTPTASFTRQNTPRSHGSSLPRSLEDEMIGEQQQKEEEGMLSVLLSPPDTLGILQTLFSAAVESNVRRRGASLDFNDITINLSLEDHLCIPNNLKDEWKNSEKMWNWQTSVFVGLLIAHKEEFLRLRLPSETAFFENLLLFLMISHGGHHLLRIAFRMERFQLVKNVIRITSPWSRLWRHLPCTTEQGQLRHHTGLSFPEVYLPEIFQAFKHGCTPSERTFWHKHDNLELYVRKEVQLLVDRTLFVQDEADEDVPSELFESAQKVFPWIERPFRNILLSKNVGRVREALSAKNGEPSSEKEKGSSYLWGTVDLLAQVAGIACHFERTQNSIAALFLREFPKDLCALTSEIFCHPTWFRDAYSLCGGSGTSYQWVERETLIRAFMRHCPSKYLEMVYSYSFSFFNGTPASACFLSQETILASPPLIVAQLNVKHLSSVVASKLPTLFVNHFFFLFTHLMHDLNGLGAHPVFSDVIDERGRRPPMELFQSDVLPSDASPLMRRTAALWKELTTGSKPRRSSILATLNDYRFDIGDAWFQDLYQSMVEPNASYGWWETTVDRHVSYLALLRYSNRANERWDCLLQDLIFTQRRREVEYGFVRNRYAFLLQTMKRVDGRKQAIALHLQRMLVETEYMRTLPFSDEDVLRIFVLLNFDFEISCYLPGLFDGTLHLHFEKHKDELQRSFASREVRELILWVSLYFMFPLDILFLMNTFEIVSIPPHRTPSFLRSQTQILVTMAHLDEVDRRLIRRFGPSQFVRYTKDVVDRRYDAAFPDTLREHPELEKVNTWSVWETFPVVMSSSARGDERQLEERRSQRAFFLRYLRVSQAFKMVEKGLVKELDVSLLPGKSWDEEVRAKADARQGQLSFTDAVQSQLLQSSTKTCPIRQFQPRLGELVFLCSNFHMSSIDLLQAFVHNHPSREGIGGGEDLFKQQLEERWKGLQCPLCRQPMHENSFWFKFDPRYFASEEDSPWLVSVEKEKSPSSTDSSLCPPREEAMGHFQTTATTKDGKKSGIW